MPETLLPPPALHRVVLALSRDAPRCVGKTTPDIGKEPAVACGGGDQELS